MDKDYKNLLTLLRMFKNRPNHLSKFLIENNALNKHFLDRIENSDKLSNINLSKTGDSHYYFTNISEMKAYYVSLVDDLELIKTKKSREDLKKYLIECLNVSILGEDFEEAARIRDFMVINKLK